jgi:homoserine acetyltransferase
LISKGESLDLTSTEVVRTYIAADMATFIIYLSDLKNAFQALVYDSKHNRVKKLDETIFLGKDRYAEIKIIDFQPQDKELLVLTKDKEKRLIHFDYDSYLYTRLEKDVYDVYRDYELDITYILTERSKKKFYTETYLEMISFKPFSRIKVDSRNDLTGILFSDQAEQLVFTTYNGELLKLDENNKLQYVGPCFDQAVAAASPGKNKQAVFINGRLFIIE